MARTAGFLPGLSAAMLCPYLVRRPSERAPSSASRQSTEVPCISDMPWAPCPVESGSVEDLVRMSEER